ncbi:MAG: hypothetical protein E7069_01215 [Bacteroidales bacterium]|jgi:hypothetical protein|nr:hypothetical protein [Bacteroidales bacterium]
MEIKNTIKKLQKEAEYFLKHAKLIVNGIEILPKEIEVYYFKEGEFEDKSVHRNELQKNNKNHFYVHRNGTKQTNSYKGGTRGGLDFVVSDDVNVFHSYLIRSAVVNGKSYVGPNNVLKSIKEASGLSLEELEKASIKLDTNKTASDVLFSSRINIPNKAEEFQDKKLRAVLCDELFRDNKYPAKEELIKRFLLSKIASHEMSQEQVINYAREKLGYVPSVLKK